MLQPLLNLHNHTPFSDGAYTIDELCAAHCELDAPIAGVGFADHLFNTPSSRPIKSEREYERIFGNELRDYRQQIDDARQRWSGKLDLYCGAEINWALNKDFMPALIRQLDGMDYVLFENLDWAGLTTLANQAKRFPCPIILAHTDVREQFPNTSIDQVVRTMANARLVYELNPKQMPFDQHHAWFKLLPQHRVRVAIGTDTHDDLSCLDKIVEIAEFATECGLGDKAFVPQPRNWQAAAS